MPEGVPPAALRPEPVLPAPAGWPFAEAFPRTCGTGRVHAGAAFWTDFLYDDHGARGLPVALPATLTPPRGTYTYPEGPAAGNGADIFRAAVGIDATHTWWRVDWNTLVDATVPIAAFGLDVDPASPGGSDWPAGAGVRSPGVDWFLVVSGTGAWLIDAASGASSPVPDHSVDMASRSFVARLPRSTVEPSGTWTVRLVSGLATPEGDQFAPVGAEHGAVPGQPAVYNVAFRTHVQEAVRSDPDDVLTANFWMDGAQSAALSTGDVTPFSLAINWAELENGVSEPEPRPTGFINRWYVSSVELGQGVTTRLATSTQPVFLGRVQPYAVNVPAQLDPATPAPLTFMLHSLGCQQNQFGAIDPRFVQEASDGRGSICVTPLGRGQAGWYFDEAELDLWEVWARVHDDHAIDPDRTVVSGYSMGGYGTYRLALSYPEVFAKAAVIAGPPTCGVRLAPGIDLPADLDGSSHCRREGETFRLLGNARWLPFYIAHGLLDELVPPLGVLEQVIELDRLGYRYRFEVYPLEDHLGYAVQDGFSSAARNMGDEVRRADPGHITFAWYPSLRRDDLGIGPHRVWWVQDLQARDAGPGVVAEVDARSFARRDPSVTPVRHGSLDLPGDPTLAVVAQQTWREGAAPEGRPMIDLRLREVSALSLDLARAGFPPGEAGTVEVYADGPVGLTLRDLRPGAAVRVDGTVMSTAGPDGSAAVAVGKGRHPVAFG